MMGGAFYRMCEYLPDALREYSPRWQQALGTTAAETFAALYEDPVRLRRFTQLLDAFSILQGEEIAAAGMTGRFTAVPADFFQGSYPAGADVITLEAILHDWSDESCRTILRHCFDALPSASWAFATQCSCHGRAPSSGSSRARPVRRQAHPLRSLRTLEKHRHIERRFALSHRVDGTGQLMREHRQRLAFALFFLQAGQRFLPCRIVAQEQHRGFGKGPLEIRMPDLCAGCAVALARRFLGTLDEAAVGDEILDPEEALNIMDFIEQY
jgi:hypothetical protein